MSQEQTKVTVVVLQQDVYKLLESRVSRGTVNQQTTDLMAGYQLGVEAVLRELRNGLVTG